MIEHAFWLSLLGLFYIYLGYPLLVKGLARLRPMSRVVPTGVLNGNEVDKKVSVVVASYNDVDNLETKLRHLFATPQEAFIEEVLIGLDGSTDDSEARIAELGIPQVRMFAFKERRGKPAVLNDLVGHAKSKIVVFCDARQILSDDAIPLMLANFEDPKIGVVSGERTFRADDSQTTAGKGIGAYWRYEKAIRKAEARFRSVPGATGALYAIRKELYRPIPESTLLDDVVIPMQAVSQGYRCIYESNAIAWDTPSDSIGKEAIRKRRTIAGAFQLVVQHPSWLLLWCNPIWLEFVSHKLMRLLSPFLLLIVASSHFALVGDPFYRVLLVVHLAFYYSAMAGWLCQRMGKPSVLFDVQLMFITLNLTAVVALWDSLRGRFRVTWKRSETQAVAAE